MSVPVYSTQGRPEPIVTRVERSTGSARSLKRSFGFSEVSYLAEDVSLLVLGPSDP